MIDSTKRIRSAYLGSPRSFFRHDVVEIDSATTRWENVLRKGDSFLGRKYVWTDRAYCCRVSQRTVSETGFGRDIDYALLIYSWSCSMKRESIVFVVALSDKYTRDCYLLVCEKKGRKKGRARFLNLRSIGWFLIAWNILKSMRTKWKWMDTMWIISELWLSLW